MFQADLSMKGKLSTMIIHPKLPEKNFFSWVWDNGFPHKGLSKEVNSYRVKNIPHLMRGLWKISLARLLKLPHFFGAVQAAIINPDGSYINLGLISLRVVTTTGVGFIVDAFQNTTEVENLKYHGIGVGTTAENVADTALETELTTEYSVNSTRATGTTTEGASANIYRTVATNTVDASVAITEYGILSQAATGGGVLLDRSVFSAINLGNGDSLQTTYDLTLTAGS